MRRALPRRGTPRVLAVECASPGALRRPRLAPGSAVDATSGGLPARPAPPARASPFRRITTLPVKHPPRGWRSPCAVAVRRRSRRGQPPLPAAGCEIDHPDNANEWLGGPAPLACAWAALWPPKRAPEGPERAQNGAQTAPAGRLPGAPPHGRYFPWNGWHGKRRGFPFPVAHHRGAVDHPLCILSLLRGSRRRCLGSGRGRGPSKLVRTYAAFMHTSICGQPVALSASCSTEQLAPRVMHRPIL
eukprot:scaffold2360_cov380-Prasinococcus_capsulatus_cf.AAC.5